MERVADFLAEYVLSKRSDTEYDYDVLKYGFQIGLEASLCLAVSIGVAIYMHMIIEFLVLLGAFVLLRSYGGGLHLNSFTLCFLCSCTAIIGVMVFAKYHGIQEGTAWGILLLCLPIIFFLGPVGSENKPLDSVEKKVFSKRLGVGLVEVIAICLLLQMVGQTKYVSLIALTVLVVMMSMMIGKLRNRSKERPL